VQPQNWLIAPTPFLALRRTIFRPHSGQTINSGLGSPSTVLSHSTCLVSVLGDDFKKTVLC